MINGNNGGIFECHQLRMQHIFVASEQCSPEHTILRAMFVQDCRFDFYASK